MVSATLIREARLRSGLSQRQLGDRLRLPKSTISRYERGLTTPSLERLMQVVAACGLQLSYGLLPADDSYDAHILRALGRTPEQRLDHVVGRTRALADMRSEARADRARRAVG